MPYSEHTLCSQQRQQKRYGGRLDSVDAPFEDGSLVFTEGYKPPSYEGVQEATIRAQMNQPTSISWNVTGGFLLPLLK